MTDHPFDFAITGAGFFRVQAPDGIRFTRDGRFHRSADGRLITAEGYPIMGANGPIRLPDGSLTATPGGELFINNELIDQFSLARFEDMTNLIKDGDTTFANQGPEPELMPVDEVKIYQGYVEESNVDSGQAVTEMMSVLRAYQASQRLVQFQDQINSQSVNELGRI